MTPPRIPRYRALMARRPQPPPKDAPGMREAWRLFDAGDKLAARREAHRILSGTADGPDAEQARELLQRTELPRTAWVLALAASALILTLILLAVARS
jgi:hypothetical protein